MSTVIVAVQKLFGSFCANGERAAEYRATEIEPYLDQTDEVVFDFDGVRNMNSSFCNSLIAPLSGRALGKLTFRNCRKGLDVLIVSALELGLKSRRDSHVEHDSAS
jgi:STAS-like domain of unknown function (DUF4325)